MKRHMIFLLLSVSLLLAGCGWLDGSVYSVTPHQQQTVSEMDENPEAANYLEFRTILEEMITGGVTGQVIRVDGFNQEQVEKGINMAVRYVTTSYPLGAYAVEDITCNLGTSGGVPAVAVEISYLHDYSQLQRIRQVKNMDQARELIAEALVDCDTSLVMLVDNYESCDISQIVEDYAAENPQLVMETPEVTDQTYPNVGMERILEVKFSYQTSRETLRTMQTQVQRIFNSAALYVSADAQETQKFSQLYAFLMERFSEYQIKTSITPAYSLLNHGVGDSRAFATVYARMCREADLECQVVVGTRNGEPWFWNLIRQDGYTYHVDLLASREVGRFRLRTDEDMDSYVWDYSAYPACTGVITQTVEETTAPTAPENEKNVE